jgi:hypothetical protein
VRNEWQDWQGIPRNSWYNFWGIYGPDLAGFFRTFSLVLHKKQMDSLNLKLIYYVTEGLFLLTLTKLSYHCYMYLQMYICTWGVCARYQRKLVFKIVS